MYLVLKTGNAEQKGQLSATNPHVPGMLLIVDSVILEKLGTFRYVPCIKTGNTE
jgi:hypothetical protein